VKFLAYMGVSLTTVEALRAAHHDAVHLGDEGLIRLPDPDIAAKAVTEGTIVVTFNLDFGDILAAARSGAPAEGFEPARGNGGRCTKRILELAALPR
jgi:predicted nuclease of predicted toxin-antitoxin system